MAKPHLAGGSSSGGPAARTQEHKGASLSRQISPRRNPKPWASNWSEAIGAGSARTSTARIGVAERSRGGGGGERIKGRRRAASTGRWNRIEIN